MKRTTTSRISECYQTRQALGFGLHLQLAMDRFEPKDDSPDPERVLLDQSRREQVRRAISHLEPEFREVIVLREIEGLSYKEISSVLDIPMGTVMSRLSRARNQLLVELGGTKLDGAGEVQHDLP
jgi:RNA polymerase sigma-70 factor (ECF subfamily)